MSAALGIRVVSALRTGAVLVARPRGVVHFHTGSLTRTGGAVPAGERPFCGTKSRRLRVVGRDVSDIGTAVAGRRFCRSCTGRLPARLGAVDLVTREGRLAAFGDLSVADLHLAGVWCRNPDETYQVQSVLMLVHGPKPIRPTSPVGVELLAAYDAIKARRDQLVAAAMTEDEFAALAANREAKAFNQRLVQKNRIREVRIEKAAAIARAGGYLRPDQRELLDSA